MSPCSLRLTDVVRIEVKHEADERRVCMGVCVCVCVSWECK